MKVEEVVAAWTNRSLHVNHEYQRGAAWNLVQQQRLIDSVLRGYPLPLFYLRKKDAPSLAGNTNVTFEVIDGQQRLIALSGYISDKWAALDPKDRRLALPDLIREQPCEWAGKTHGQLPEDVRRKLTGTVLHVVIIDAADSEDEIRDLFIRLQAGTALTRQQIRDAMPGNLGPYVERLAGKVDRRPRFECFAAVDRRGFRAADEGLAEEDPYHDDRQTCAQLLRLFLSRRHDPKDIPSVESRQLDDMYHERTSFDPSAVEALDFEKALDAMDRVIKKAAPGKLRKNVVFSLFLLLDDLAAATDVNLQAAIPLIAATFAGNSPQGEPSGRVATGGTIARHFQWSVEEKMRSLSVPGLDPQRLFNDEQKDAIWERSKDDAGRVVCHACREPVDRADAQYHHGIPWIRGGRTEPGNGHVVHPGCHARGRAAITLRRA